MGALSARRRFAAITGSKFRIESYPLVASSQYVGAAAAVIILQLEFVLVEQLKTIHKFVGSNFNQSEIKKISFGIYATVFILEPINIGTYEY